MSSDLVTRGLQEFESPLVLKTEESLMCQSPNSMRENIQALMMGGLGSCDLPQNCNYSDPNKKAPYKLNLGLKI